jgi:hypothetical protein
MRKHLKKPSPAMGVALIALFIALGGTTYAATGGNFILGQANTATTQTSLSSTNTGAPTLNVVNTGGRPAARFQANGGKAPFTVNSGTKVANLNGDLLDGYDSNALVRAGRMSTSGTTALGNTSAVTYGTPLSITAPSTGFVIVNASITLLNEGCTGTGSECDVNGWIRHIKNDEHSTVSQETVNDHLHNMAQAYVFPVSAGVHTFDIRLTRVGTTGQIFGWFASMNALFVPFGSTGTGTLGATSSGSATKK